eukprot:2206284-Pleurochrysis_carterae.AAC.3
MERHPFFIKIWPRNATRDTARRGATADHSADRCTDAHIERFLSASGARTIRTIVNACARWYASARVQRRDVHAGRRLAEGAARWRACALRSVGVRRRDDPE